MTRTILALTAAAAALSLVGAAEAQPRGGRSATLYEMPNFQGRSVTITGSVPDLGDWRFNDRAQSARFQGRWQVCEHDEFRGRCQQVSGDVADLTTYGMLGQISSLEPAGFARPGPGAGGPGGGWGGPRERGADGARTVFFARPSVRGLDVAAGQRGADTFCRHQGLGGAVYFDSSERASQALGPDGELVGRSSVLRDLLCRKY